jgi:WD domain, G-beta repeat
VRSARFSPDGKHVVTASDDTTARIWDISHIPPSFVPLIGHRRAVLDAAFSPDGRLVVTASKDGTARVWDLSGKPRMILDGHRNTVRTAAFNAGGNLVVTASDDGTARVWDLAAEHPTSVVLLGHQGGVTVAAFSPDGRRIVTASDDMTARLFPYFPDIRELIQSVVPALGRCLTEAQREQYGLRTNEDVANRNRIVAPDAAGRCPGEDAPSLSRQASTSAGAHTADDAHRAGGPQGG